MELDLDDNPLKALAESSPRDLRKGLDLADDRRILNGIPEFGYRVIRGYGLLDMALWRVKFLGEVVSPIRRGENYVLFEWVECLWKGAMASDPREAKGRMPLKGFDLTLTDAICTMSGLRDKYALEVSNSIVAGLATIRKYEAEIEQQRAYLKTLHTFSPEAVVPSDILDEEDREMERELAELAAEEVAGV